VPSGGSFALSSASAGLVISTDFRLDVAATGLGSVTSQPAGIACVPGGAASACAAEYDGGTRVSLDAAPDPGHGFTGWGGACSGDATTCELTMDRARTVSAGFENVPPVVSGLAMDPNPFVTTPDDTPLERKAGTRIKLKLSEDARVRFRVRSNPVRRGGGPPPRRARSFTRELELGKSSVRFTGRLDGRAFAPGRYVLIARARDDGGLKSERVRVRFSVAQG